MWWGHREGTSFEVGFLSLLGKCKYCKAGGINRRVRAWEAAGGAIIGSGAAKLSRRNAEFSG